MLYTMCMFSSFPFKQQTCLESWIFIMCLQSCLQLLAIRLHLVLEATTLVPISHKFVLIVTSSPIVTQHANSGMPPTALPWRNRIGSRQSSDLSCSGGALARPYHVCGGLLLPFPLLPPWPRQWTPQPRHGPIVETLSVALPPTVPTIWLA